MCVHFARVTLNLLSCHEYEAKIRKKDSKKAAKVGRGSGRTETGPVSTVSERYNSVGFVSFDLMNDCVSGCPWELLD